MNNLYTYSKFVKLYEAETTDLTKNLVGLDANLNTEYQNTIKMIANPPEQQKAITDFSRLNKEFVTKTFTTDDNILKIRKTIFSALKTVYTTLLSTIDKLANKEFTLEKIFQSSTDNTKKIFTMKLEDFNKNFLLFVNELISFYASQQKIDAIKLKEYFNKYPDVMKIEDNKTTTEPIKQTEAQIKQTSTIQTGTIEIDADQLEKIKTSILQYLDKNIYKPMVTAITRVKPEQSVQVQAKSVADKTTTTQNKDGVAKIIKNISQMKPAELNKLRDQIGLSAAEVGSF